MYRKSMLWTRNSTGRTTTGIASILKTIAWVPVACACMLYNQFALGAGGCGSVCLPLNAVDPERTQLRERQYRFALTAEHADFDQFREGDDSIFNPGGNEATISQFTLFLEYGLNQRWTLSLLIPYLRKKQQTNRFGTRVAEGVSDLSVFGRYELLAISPQTSARSLSLGLGLKIPSGSIDEPNNAQLLPPAFQAGSGAVDMVPTVSYYQPINSGSLFGNAFWRIPLDENRNGYKFGQEFEFNVGGEYRLPIGNDHISLLLSMSLLAAGHDRDTASLLPARVRDGSKVLNTGGRFVDLVPGIRVRLSNTVTMQAHVAFPIYEDWNGSRDRNVGQVAPNRTFQLTLVYTGYRDRAKGLDSIN